MNPPHAIYSARQRTLVLTFDTVAEAEAWDRLTGADAVAAVLEHGCRAPIRRRTGVPRPPTTANRGDPPRYQGE